MIGPFHGWRPSKELCSLPMHVQKKKKFLPAHFQLIVEYVRNITMKPRIRQVDIKFDSPLAPLSIGTSQITMSLGMIASPPLRQPRRHDEDDLDAASRRPCKMRMY
jgi:hypothetical protein